MADDKKGLRIGEFRPGAFITGPLQWENHLKVFVFIVILFIWFCIYSFISGFFHKPSLDQKSDTRIGGDVGALNTNDNHSNVTENHWHFPLSDILSMGSKDKKVIDGR